MKQALSKLLTTRADENPHADRVICSALGDAGFPLVIKPRAAGLLLPEWAMENKEFLKMKLPVHGAILFRGFHIDTVEKFERFIQVFDAAPMEYRQRSSPRYAVGKNIYHSTTYPADQSINMHSENSYAYKWPMKIVFCCLQPAGEHGETPIADTRKVLSLLSDATREKFGKFGVRYVRHISPGLGLSWQEVFQTNDRQVVEQECLAGGMTFSWVEEDCLAITWDHQAIHRHPGTQEPVWFNHAFFFNQYALEEEVRASFLSGDELPFNTSYGDGTPITPEEVDEIRAAYRQATVTFTWEKGDVLFLDNMLMAHGRNAYKGSRQVIVSMFDDHS